MNGLYIAYEHFRRSLLSGSGCAEEAYKLQSASETLDIADDLHHIIERLQSDKFSKDGRSEAYTQLMLMPTSIDLLYDVASSRLSDISSNEEMERKNRFDGWDWSFIAESLILAYQFSGRKELADLVWKSFDEALRVRDNERGLYDAVRNRYMRTWGRGDHVDGKWTAVVTTAGRMSYPIFRLARLTSGEAGFEASEGQRSYYVEEAVMALSEFESEFEMAGQHLGYYRRPTRGDIEPLNHALSAGRAMLEYSILSGDSNSSEKAAQLARFFRWAIWEDDGGSYVWAYQPTIENRKQRRPNLVWKADVDLSFALLAKEHGIEFSGDDVKKFCSTFYSNICLPSGQFNSYIGRQKIVPLEEKQKKGKRKPHGFLTWNALASYDCEIGRIIDEQVANSREIFFEGWFGSARSTYSYAQRLSYRRSVDPEP